MLNLLGIISANFMFSPPEGWTMIESDHAVKDASAFEQGELVEILIKENELNQLGFALMNRGFGVESIVLNPYGHADLTLSDRVGHARWSDEQRSWTVLFANQDALNDYDLNELFRNMAENRLGSKREKDDQTKGWTPKTSNYWGRNPDLFGEWSGSSLIKGLATQFNFLFESDGTLRIERSIEGKTKTITGRWMTNKDNLRLIYSNQSKLTSFSQLGSTLQFEFERANVTFYRK